ncbi:MAG TPA: hypothetical protein VMF69_27395, partial [Gemmataceae bacterium]|nr:hypothetical protein [Gemmataceae bacterium]
PLKGRTNLSVEMDLYKDGKKQPTHFSSGLSSTYEAPVRAKVALLAADLDYLPLAPLAGAQKERFRMQILLRLPMSWGGEGGTGMTMDVSPLTFDFSRVNGGNGFPPQAGSETEVPLFWLFVRPEEVKGVIGMDTVSGVIEKNAKGDLLIAYLRLWKK